MKTDKNNYLSQLINECVEYYIHIATKEYPNLSSFAIVSVEGFETFNIAINTNGFFSDLENYAISDEDYWNTAEWTEELLDYKYQNAKFDEIYKILNENICDEDENSNKNFLKMCKNALINGRKLLGNEVCMFVHLTDFGTSEELKNIVFELNNQKIYNSYLDYYS